MLYNKLNTYWKTRYGKRVQRIPVSTGLGCPNRADGSGGCIFCDPSGSGFAAERPDMLISQQIKNMIERTEKKYGEDIYFAIYFQSYTNTYASEKKLKEIFDQVFVDDRIKILDISTRPDCVEDNKLDLIKSYSDRADIIVEYGLQSVNRKTLVDLNRGHTLADFIDAVERTKKRGLETLAHIIVDLPQDSMDDIIEAAQILSALKVDGVKLHSLYVVNDTELDRRMKAGVYTLLDFDTYLEREIAFLENLDPEIVVHRLCSEPPTEGAYGNWGKLKVQVIQSIENELKRRETCQGKKFNYFKR
jgi:radical SAM protein (TIGR01212 family)